MTENTNPVKVIRAKCIDCCCDQVSEVAKCTTVNCPLYKWRFGKNPYRKQMSDEQREVCRQTGRKNAGILQAYREAKNGNGNDQDQILQSDDHED